MDFSSRAPARTHIFDPNSLRSQVEQQKRSQNASMQPIGPVFEKLQLTAYTNVFVENGFDTWEDVLDITENDLEVLNVRLGHRRRLQREIADYKGVPIEQVLVVPGRASSIKASGAGEGGSATQRADGNSGVTSTGKRRYRRHPKPDAIAPERPPSAYVLFSNEIRDELKSQNLSFTDMAKLVGERWQQLDTEGRDPYESKANRMKEKFNSEMNEYKKTDEFREYSNYLTEFKASQQAQGTGNDGKRLKLERAGDSHGSSRGSQGTPTTSTHGSPISTTAGLNEGHSNYAQSPQSGPYAPTYSSGKSGRTSAGLMNRPSIMSQFPSEQNPSQGQPLPSVSGIAQRSLPRRSENQPPPPFLHRSQETSSGSVSSAGAYTPLTPADTVSTSSSAGMEGAPHSHHALKGLSLYALKDRPGSSGPSGAYPGPGNSSSPHPTFTGPEHASRTLPPLNMMNPSGSMSQQTQSQHQRVDGLSVLALAGRILDGERDMPSREQPSKPP